MKNKYVALIVIAAFVSVFAAPAFASVTYMPGTAPITSENLYDTDGNIYQYNNQSGTYQSNGVNAPQGSPLKDSNGNTFYVNSQPSYNNNRGNVVNGIVGILGAIIGNAQQRSLEKKQAEYQQRLAEQGRQNQEKLSQMQAQAEAERQQQTMEIAKRLESFAQSDAIATARSCEQRGMSKTFSMIQDICTQNKWEYTTRVVNGMQCVMWSSTDTPPIVSVIAFEPKTHNIISTKGIPGITNDLMIFDVQQVNGKIKP